MPMDGDVGAAITETFDNFIKVLEKNGISMK
ncbi:hypothetical protein CIY_13980 [Butyrivibrio fibrisolvens 16/4]|nr:hypothetical protein CIY_13980 [Butyrivibrio fibrisolvens 16/4]